MPRVGGKCANLGELISAGVDVPPGFAVIGFAVTEMDDESFRTGMRDLVQKSPEVLVFRQKLWDAFAPALGKATTFDGKPFALPRCPGRTPTPTAG